MLWAGEQRRVRTSLRKPESREGPWPQRERLSMADIKKIEGNGTVFKVIKCDYMQVNCSFLINFFFSKQNSRKSTSIVQPGVPICGCPEAWARPSCLHAALCAPGAKAPRQRAPGQRGLHNKPLPGRAAFCPVRPAPTSPRPGAAAPRARPPAHDPCGPEERRGGQAAPRPPKLRGQARRRRSSAPCPLGRSCERLCAPPPLQDPAR